MHFISGLPRSGSTLLGALLRQSPDFHAGMTSPVGGWRGLRRSDERPGSCLPAPRQVVRGTAMIDGEARSLIGRLWRSVAAVAIRESGF